MGNVIDYFRKNTLPEIPVDALMSLRIHRITAEGNPLISTLRACLVQEAVERLLAEGLEQGATDGLPVEERREHGRDRQDLPGERRDHSNRFAEGVEGR